MSRRRQRTQRRAGGTAARGRHGPTGRRAAPSPWRQARVPITIGVALLFLLILWFTGYVLFRGSVTPSPNAATASSLVPPEPATTPDAGSGRPALPARGRAFDGDAAFQRLKEQCDFGPRVPGTEGHAKCLTYLVSTLKGATPRVEEQSFNFRDGSRDVRMVNLIARFPAGSDGKTARQGSGLIVAAHWDTRPTADQEPDVARRRQPILGANDGASGVAVLLELARVLKAKPPAVPVWLVLFDGEDYGPGLDRMFLGAKQFAAHLPEGCPPKGVLLDMIGDRDLEVFKEVNSVTRAGAVVDSVWGTARRLGYQKQFNPSPFHAIEDDHIPLLNKGIAMIDVIDFDYPYWHTLGDTVDKCAPKSLQVIGDVVAAWIYDHRS